MSRQEQQLIERLKVEMRKNNMIRDLVLDALRDDNIDHKQYYLEQVLETLGLEIKSWKKLYEYEWSSGVKPRKRM